jgi:hypothetical protein
MRGARIVSLLPALVVVAAAAACSTTSSAPSDASADDVTLRPSPTGYPCGSLEAGSSTSYCFAATYCLLSTVAGQVVSSSCQDFTPACPPGGDADLPDCTCVAQNAGLTGCSCAIDQGELVLTCPLQDAATPIAPDAGLDARAEGGADAALDAPLEAALEAGLEAAAEASLDAAVDGAVDGGDGGDGATGD